MNAKTKYKRVVALLALVVLAVAAGVYLLRERPQLPEIVTVEKRLAADMLYERGFLESAAITPVQLGATGEIREMTEDGEVVVVGQIVTRIDETAYLEQRANLDVDIETAQTTLAIRQTEREAAEEEIVDTLVLASNSLVLAEMELDKIQRGLTPDERRELRIACELRAIELAEADDVVARERVWVAEGLASAVTLEDAERRLESARAGLEEAQIEYDIQTGPPLAEKLLEGMRTVDRLRGEVQRGQRAGERQLAKIDAELAEAQAGLRLNLADAWQASNEWAQCSVAAPTSGVFRSRMFSDWRQGGIWQAIKPGVKRGRLDRIADIVQPGEMRVQIMLHEADIERVTTGMPVRVQVPALGNERTFRGVLYNVGGVGRDRYDVSTRGIEQSVSGVTVFNTSIKLIDSDPAFRPGMSVLAAILCEPERERLLIPREAVGQREATGDCVRMADGRFHSVSGGMIGRRFYEVTEGLQAGDRIWQVFTEAGP